MAEKMIILQLYLFNEPQQQFTYFSISACVSLSAYKNSKRNSRLSFHMILTVTSSITPIVEGMR